MKTSKKSIFLILVSFTLLFSISQDFLGRSEVNLEIPRRVLKRIGAGASLFDDGEHGDGKAGDGIFSALINKPKLAFKRGLGLADPRPTPVQKGTRIFFNIDSRGNVIFRLNSNDYMLNVNNRKTAVYVNRKQLPKEIKISYDPFSKNCTPFAGSDVTRIIVQ